MNGMCDIFMKKVMFAKGKEACAQYPYMPLNFIHFLPTKPTNFLHFKTR